MTESALDCDDWRNRVIVGSKLGATELPFWAEPCYQILHDEVTDDAYPCFFGVQAEKRGEMFYAFVSRDAEGILPRIMTQFAQLAQLPIYEKNNIAVFFEPDPIPLSHHAYQARFWRTLQLLHDADTHPHADHQVDPSDPAWEFSYQGVEMFVVCACPSFKKRHSRNLGPGMVLLFQPRSVFIDKITNKVIGKRARQQVRERLKRWDDIGAHPDLGFYGEPGNLEWKQYFLPDNNLAHSGGCPFLRRQETQAPLTPTQEGLWFLWRLEPGSAAYHLSQALELEGPVDAGTLRQKLIPIVNRHPILRTRFLERDGVPIQRVDLDFAHAIDWLEEDFHLTAQPVAQACELLRERGNRRFDLSRGGMLRVTLLRVAEARWILQICTHQIVMDVWSLDELRRELLSDTPNPRLQILKPVSDSSLWAEQLAYWRTRLREATEVLDLPFDRPRRARRSTIGARLEYRMPPEIHGSVQQLASVLNTTPFAVALGTFALLLHRYSGQQDLCIAVPLQRQFMNTAIVRLQVLSTDSFTAFIDQTQRYLAEAQAHGDLPFVQLVRSLRVHRSRSFIDTPLCQVSCGELPLVASEHYGELSVRAFDDAVGRAQYDLSLNVAIDDRGGALFMDYASELFNPSSAQRLLTHYVELLRQLTQGQESLVRTLASLQLDATGEGASAAA